jgi:hypothetical protein
MTAFTLTVLMVTVSAAPDRGESRRQVIPRQVHFLS